MATFKTITSDDIKTTTTTLNQLVDFVEEDISGSSTRTSLEQNRFKAFCWHKHCCVKTVQT